VVHPNVAEQLQQEFELGDAIIIKIDSSTIAELHNIDSLWRRSLREWSVADEYAQRADADHCILMSLNWFQLALGFPSACSVPYTLSGVFFFPYVRIEPVANGFLNQIRYQVRRFRKWVTLRWMMRNPKLSTVFVLNDPVAADQLNRRVDTHKQRFRALLDPVLHPREGQGPIEEELRETYNIAEKRCVFLFGGTVSKRKGILKALEAFERISAEERSRSTLLVLGRLKEEVAGEVEKRVQQLRGFKDLQIRTDFRFLSESEFNRAIRECDIILAPYQRTEGSSGLLGHAARTRRPVIGPKDGLIGSLIQEYNLGITVEATRSEQIADAISRALDGRVQIDVDLAARYVRERTPNQFAQRILSSTAAAC
jgi:glycosyltransferase involved in cell wall biosynthesis